MKIIIKFPRWLMLFFFIVFFSFDTRAQGTPCEPAVITQLSSPETICNGLSTNLSVINGSLGGGVIWRWYSESCSGTPIGSGVSLSVTPTVTTTYFVRAEDGCLTESECGQITITVDNNCPPITPCLQPVINSIIPDQTICLGSSIELSVEGDRGDATDWIWYQDACGEGIPIGEGTLTLIPETTTTYFVRGEGGCVTQSECLSVTITIENQPEVNIASNIESNTICEETPVTFTATPINGGSNPSYQWKLNGENIGTNSNTFTSSGLAINSHISVEMTPGDATVVVGSQTWASKNLNVSTYLNGDPIPNVTDLTEWAGLTTGAWCWFNNDSATYGELYGKLYNWYAVHDQRGLAPQGFRISTAYDWDILNANYQDGVAALTALMINNSTYYFANNSSGFNGVAGGVRINNGGFVDEGVYGNYWTPTMIDNESSNSILIHSNGIGTGSSNSYKTGCSVRCIKIENSSTGCYTNTPATSNEITINVGSISSDTAIKACGSYTWFGTTYTESINNLSVCATANEGEDLIINAPEGAVFTAVNFASYGNPTGDCHNFILGDCHDENSKSIVENYLIGNSYAIIPTNNQIFSDECSGLVKRLYVEAFYEFSNNGSSNAPTHTFTNVNGCDSVVTLHLTISNPDNTDTSAFACGSFVWHGTTYTESTNAPTYTYTNVNGCDSVVTLHLTIGSSVTSQPVISDSTSICIGTSTTINILSGQLGGATNWYWYKGECGGTPIDSGLAITVTPDTTTTYYVRGEGGCITPGACKHVTIAVRNLPGIPVVNDTVPSPCSIELDIVSNNLNGGNNWNWFKDACGTNQIGTGNSITFTPVIRMQANDTDTLPDTYSFYVRGQGGCAGAGTPCTLVTVDVPPHPTITYDLSHSESCDSANIYHGNGTVTVENISGGIPDARILSSGNTLFGSSPNYTIELSGTNYFSSNSTGLFQNLRAGNYYVKVKDEWLCNIVPTSQMVTIVQLTPITCVVPDFLPPDSGYIDAPMGTTLTQISADTTIIDNTSENPGNSFTTDADLGSILIDIIAVDGKHDTLLSLLQTPLYGLSNMYDNGDDSLTITGWFPVGHLLRLNALNPSLLRFAEANRRPINNTSKQGIVVSKGDVSMKSDAAREAFDLYGNGVKVGVISNSYNTKTGNPALTDVRNGDLPGIGNTYNANPVKVLEEYPYGKQTDEGRAMLQIVHDIAPKAKLEFCTGFITSGHFAESIKALANDSCDIIVDDVTFVNEPFFTDGVVAKAVDEVASRGVSYFSAAGNFGDKSYESVFNPVPAPSGFTGYAHDFGSGDLYQSVTLQPGAYNIVLQWEDSIYSLGQLPGAQNDYDIYLLNQSGGLMFGFNRKNIGEDPIEVLPFTVKGITNANIMIVRKSGTANLRFKYVVFKGEITINEHNAGTSTLFGQANAAGAMSVASVLYTNTPAFGVSTPTVSSFSSRGGTRTDGSLRNKPDFCAPNGVNTTVAMGGVNIDGDVFPNFFGTSCAAPHAAGVAALLIEAKRKFYSDSLYPS